jgi:4a-hydroxytetrahydrobiopterin dehydratase
MPKLTDDEVGAALGRLPGWSFDGSTIRKEFSFKGFTSAVGFAGRLVEPANAARHHPDLEIHYNRVVVTLSTHDEGGVTERDLALARTIEDVAESQDP